MAPTDRFRAAVQEAKIGPDKDIPHVTAPIIVKYLTNLRGCSDCYDGGGGRCAGLREGFVAS